MKKLFCLATTLLLGEYSAWAQISPGKLSSAHHDLEGITNCTQCHESGKEVSREKCLSCHVEIRREIVEGHGFHFVNGATHCISCHKEHLGVEARITRFDERQFDHAQTGFSLAGKHASISCEKCHFEGNIKVAEVRSRLAKSPHKTFLGIDRSCASCHQDKHRGSVGAKCEKCHSSLAWVPASVFDHGASRFPLIGKHKALSCEKCHGGMAHRSPAVPVLFATTGFSDCTPCHASPHGSKFSDRTCRSCHSAEGWTSVTGFNHSDTRFPLIGKHANVACEKCHTSMSKRELKAVSFITRSFDDCAPCHTSPHARSIASLSCRSCHTSTAWGTRVSERFDHSLTKFTLVGKHAEIICEQCHKISLGASFEKRFRLRFRRCIDCHEDAHQGRFILKFANDCAACHTQSAYKPSTFSIVRHLEARFSLEGAHRAVPCVNCHHKIGQAGWNFQIKDIRCESCHPDKHNGQFLVEMAELSCARCHSTTDWTMTSFDHSTTGFPLVGKHALVKCTECHKEVEIHGARTVQYRGVPKQCSSCHTDAHEGQFAAGGVTDCAPCHTPRNWHAPIFNHDTQSIFSLTGAHRNVSCRSCHKEERSGSRMFIRYKPLSAKCESCHQNGK